MRRRADEQSIPRTPRASVFKMDDFGEGDEKNVWQVDKLTSADIVQ